MLPCLHLAGEGRFLTRQYSCRALTSTAALGEDAATVELPPADIMRHFNDPFSRLLLPPGNRPLTLLAVLAIFTAATGALATRVVAQPHSPDLLDLPVCSAATVPSITPSGACTVEPLGNGRNKLTIRLTAQTSEVEVAGYRLTTENYNGAYLTPVIEAMPGDTVAARLVNVLAPPTHAGMAHGSDNPTNLHYFHGGIVSPANARPTPAERGNGDNVYVYLKNGTEREGGQNRFDFKVPIPGDQELDARVLEKEGKIAHPLGLNWYHSHLHGISSDQVLGGMSGLLSVGEAKANVQAACREEPGDPARCLNDVARETAELRARTKVHYAMLRDLVLGNISAPPQNAAVATADWAPRDRNFAPGSKCGVWKADGSGFDNDNPRLRAGFCQRDERSAWLFTLNGQRYPTITVEGGANLLLRLGNLSANVAYWLELYNEKSGTILPLWLLSLDGVVPHRPVPPEQAKRPVAAAGYADLLLMPAARAELYVRNDERPHDRQEVYVLRTKGLSGIGGDEWPEIQLARIVLEPNAATSPVGVGLNALVAQVSPELKAERAAAEPIMPPGCIRDLDPAFNEYRRVTFIGPLGTTPEGDPTWSIQTEIIRPEGSTSKDESEHQSKDPDQTTINRPFEDYMLTDGLIDWAKPHVCIYMDRTIHAGSHKQLWVLWNATDTLHNFHIHQMKFRLATRKDLQQHHITPPDPSHTCADPATCGAPDIALYDDETSAVAKATPLWHDTIPVPPFAKMFIVMSFDAPQQIGRFVFHCHILKHEDNGLMAPIEVWEPPTVAQQ
jgi:FtsP/CotA-like multicopper oxidase with cupredoxin domain